MAGPLHPLIYVRRPNGESLWLPARVTREIRATWGDQLTPEKYESRAVQELIAKRLQTKEEELC